jgi:bacterioferritin
VDQESLIALLNEDLELEHRSIVQYINHIAIVKGAQYQSTLEELGRHVNQEVQHALALARQIDFLGGTPSTSMPAIPPSAGGRDALAEDLKLEMAQLERYRERVAQAEELGLPDVAEVLAPLLEQTQEHARDLRAALG